MRLSTAGSAEPQSPREGVARDLTYWSESNRRNIWIKVYTPPGYDAGTERYPVVYNLHGAGGGSPQRQWKRAGATLKDAIENRKVRPMVYVFVNGMGDTFFLDYEDGSVKAETAIVRELIPFIDGRYRTIASAEGRAIDGFSMGGGGAIRIALKYPEAVQLRRLLRRRADSRGPAAPEPAPLRIAGVLRARQSLDPDRGER